MLILQQNQDGIPLNKKIVFCEVNFRSALSLICAAEGRFEISSGVENFSDARGRQCYDAPAPLPVPTRHTHYTNYHSLLSLTLWPSG